MKKNRLELEKRDAEIKALQAQITPHFLYNTLGTINFMINENKKDKSIFMVNALSDLFRYGISRKELLISIKEEIRYTRAYTHIMNLRYHDTIEFIWEIDNSVLDYSIIKLILQPIVENAIDHGVSRIKGEKRIFLLCYGQDDCIVFEIRDNGIGIERSELEDIQNKLNNNEMEEKIGIHNVQSRIHLYYGTDYGIQIESEKGLGTTVRVRIPRKLEIANISEK